MGNQETIRIRIEKTEEGLITAFAVKEDGEVIEDSKLLQLLPGSNFKLEYIKEGLVYDASIGSHGEKKFLNFTKLVEGQTVSIGGDNTIQTTESPLPHNTFKPASKDIGNNDIYDRSQLMAEVALEQAVKVVLACYDKEEIVIDDINKGITDEWKILYKSLKNKEYEK